MEIDAGRTSSEYQVPCVQLLNWSMLPEDNNTLLLISGNKHLAEFVSIEILCKLTPTPHRPKNPLPLSRDEQKAGKQMKGTNYNRKHDLKLDQLVNLLRL